MPGATRRPRKRDELYEKIRRLPPERVAEVEDFVDFLHLRDEARSLSHAAARVSEGAFARIWENPDDAEYDPL